MWLQGEPVNRIFNDSLLEQKKKRYHLISPKITRFSERHLFLNRNASNPFKFLYAQPSQHKFNHFCVFQPQIVRENRGFSFGSRSYEILVKNSKAVGVLKKCITNFMDFNLYAKIFSTIFKKKINKYILYILQKLKWKSTSNKQFSAFLSSLQSWLILIPNLPFYSFIYLFF